MHRLGLLRWRRSADVPLIDAGGLNPDVTTLLEAANFSTAVVALATTEPSRDAVVFRIRIGRNVGSDMSHDRRRATMC